MSQEDITYNVKHQTDSSRAKISTKLICFSISNTLYSPLVKIKIKIKKERCYKVQVLGMEYLTK